MLAGLNNLLLSLVLCYIHSIYSAHEILTFVSMQAANFGANAPNLATK